MDYYAIGQRIRKVRKAKDISQEELAEKVGISTTHMSHIETANTKLSLPVFVAISEALEIPADSLLYDESPNNINTSMQEISSIITSCPAKQAKVIASIVQAIKQSMDAYL